MNDQSKCKQCGAPLPADAPGGICPVCVLQLGLASPSFASEPMATDLLASRAGAHAASPAPEELSRRFPNLEFIELLGRGGMGAVYKARQIGLDRIVAVKILPQQVSDHPSFAERFTREARALARLNHPQIVSVYDFGEREGLYYFLMEYVDGLNLRQLLHQGELTPTAALAIVPQICDALQYAHDEGVVHRDIKPENILVDKKGRVKIADFGLAKMLTQTAGNISLTGTNQVMGTFHYMAPEQVEHPQTVDHRADIYALGVVFYELLTRELPLGRFPVPSQRVQIDVRLDEIVMRSLEKEPARRYQHASQVKTEIEAVAASPRVPVARPAPRRPYTDPPPVHSPPAPIDEADARRLVHGPGLAMQIAGAVCALPALVVIAGIVAMILARLSR